MARPTVSITLLNGQLGQTSQTDDGIAGMLMTGVATGSIALGATEQVFSLKDVEDLGLDEAYDTTNTTNVYKTMKDFYAQAGNGAECWIQIVAKTTTMATMCDIANDILKKLINDSGRRVRFVGVVRVPDGAYDPEYADQLDPDVIAAAAKAQQLAEQFASEFAPVRVIIDGRDFQGNTGTLLDLKGSTYNRVAIPLFTDVSGSVNSAVGLVVGRLANIPVQRNIGRVKDGALGIASAYLTGQTALIDSLAVAAQDAVHDKGFISARKFANRNGYYFTDDPTATSDDDDYNSIARGRVVDKAIVIANEVFTDEILDDIEVDDNGFIDAGVIKDYQSKIKKEIDAQMTTPGEISRIRPVMDPKQNVLSTNKVNLDLFITPKGKNKEIAIRLGYENPANA